MTQIASSYAKKSLAVINNIPATGGKNQEDIEVISDCGADFIVVSSMIETYVNL